MVKKIEKVLVANRGEIAIRVFRACSDLYMRTVAIYSEEDKAGLFRTRADESYQIGRGSSPLGAYLDIEGIIRLALEKEVDAIHPGYGFLSENADFAKACEDAGILFVGPPSSVLAQMGDKLKAKEIAKLAQVPVIPGSQKPLVDEQEAVRLANDFGYPVILKASAGGGGRGMRLVYSDEEVRTQFHVVKEEARKAFDNDDVFMEKYIEDPKHIEVQILGDQYGNIVHLFERDCSVQRRYQKVVEFAPAFTIPKEKLDQIHADAIKIAKQVGYVNAGTVEFLVDKHGDHYFIEMNPRIQVEHTVTEMITGIDLVQTQLLIAEGYALDSGEINISQQNISPLGYAIQCRVTTEDPRNNFAPDTGRISVYRSGGGFGVRLDAGNAYTGAIVTPYYDSLLVKITTWDRTFSGAIHIGEIRIRGVNTNIPFVANVLRHPTFESGRCTTKFIDNCPELFDLEAQQDRGTKALKYISNIIVNERPEHRPVIDPKLPQGYIGQPKAGIKQLLDEKGPEAVQQFVLDQKKTLVSDTTFRDAHQSLLATRVRTRDILTVSRQTAHILADAFSLEMWGGATFDVAYRFLDESPWVRLDEMRKRIPNIPFQMLLRGANAVGYTNYPDNVVRAFIRKAAEHGIDVFRVFDSLNWLEGMQVALDEVLSTGKICEATICYTNNILDEKNDKYPLSYYVNLAKQLEKTGAHTLCIKDMSGLLKPFAASKLVRALKDEISIPVHLHTHDTSGNQIASLIRAIEEGVDIVDCAIASMSSLTSQPSINSLNEALLDTPYELGYDKKGLQQLSDYWADVREMYGKFEAGLDYPDTEIYRLEIPGGQYSNLKPQVQSLGLMDRFDEVKEMFCTVNRILGDIIKVTPSSKMVGDFAIFMVQNDLNEENLLERGRDLTFPDSVVSYFKGMMGQPQGGFPKDLQKIVLKGEEPITCRPGELLEDVDFEAIRSRLPEKYQSDECVLASCLYPKVFDDFVKRQQEYGDISRMHTSVFFGGMQPGQTTEITIEDGKTLIIRYLGMGELLEDGTRNVIFELNGAQRIVNIKENDAVSKVQETVMADQSNVLHASSSIPGIVSKILVRPGEEVLENQTLMVVEAMKMETAIVARTQGKVHHINVKEGQPIKSGELLLTLE